MRVTPLELFFVVSAQVFYIQVKLDFFSLDEICFLMTSNDPILSFLVKMKIKFNLKDYLKSFSIKLPPKLLGYALND